MGTLKNFRKKVSQSRKILIVPKRTFCFGILVKKLAQTHGFEHETSGLKSKHLTTRPRTPELCDLRAETRELSRGKKHPHFSITLAHRKCKKSQNSFRRTKKFDLKISTTTFCDLKYNFCHLYFETDV